MGTNIWEQFPELKKIPREKFPEHVLIIPDGNGRWANKFHYLPVIGHRNGYKVLKEIIRKMQELPIIILTVWAFSSDNWKRSKKEIYSLMQIFEQAVGEMEEELMQKKIRFIHLGRKDRIPKTLKKAIEKLESKTNKNKGLIFSLAIDFSGQDQELRMMETIHNLPKNTKITLDLVRKLRDANGEIPPSDLIIRTSGEQRTSDLGWLSQNSEFYSISKLLPDAKVNDFIEAIIDYSKRERRFGARKK